MKRLAFTLLLMSAICFADTQSTAVKEKPPIVLAIERTYFLVSPKELFIIGIKKEYRVTFNNPYVEGLKHYLVVGPDKALAGIKVSY